MTLASAVALLIGFALNAILQATIPSSFDVASVKQNIVGITDMRGINEGPGHGPEN